MKKIVRFYIKNPKLIGALFCIVPTCVLFAVDLKTMEYRQVYALRFAIAVILGGWLSGWLNKYGMELVLIKHGSKYGPATAKDGAIVGAGIGFGCALIPPATLLIESSNIELAKWTVMAIWLGGVLLGAVIGSLVAKVGLKRIQGK